MGDTKYRAIVKSRNNLLQNIKWNRRNDPLDQNVSNHRTTIDNLRNCATHIGSSPPNTTQGMEFLLESITSQDNSLQAAIRNIRADTNGFRSDFEGALRQLTEVDPYRRSTKSNPTKPNPVKVSVVRVSGQGKLEWTFIVTLDRNFLISPVSRKINCHPGKGQIKAKPPSRNSGILTEISGKVTQKIPIKGTGERNLRNQLSCNQDYHKLCPS